MVPLGVGDFWWRKQGSRSPGHQEWSKEKDGRMESHTKGTVSHSTCVWGCGKAVWSWHWLLGSVIQSQISEAKKKRISLAGLWVLAEKDRQIKTHKRIGWPHQEMLLINKGLAWLSHIQNYSKNQAKLEWQPLCDTFSSLLSFSPSQQVISSDTENNLNKAGQYQLKEQHICILTNQKGHVYMENAESYSAVTKEKQQDGGLMPWCR